MKTLIAAVAAGCCTPRPQPQPNPRDSRSRNRPARMRSGITALHLVDHDRPDTWVPHADRELMVSLFYPTEDRDGPRTKYVTPEESRLILESLRVKRCSRRDPQHDPHTSGGGCVAAGPETAAGALARTQLPALVADRAGRGPRQLRLRRSQPARPISSKAENGAISFFSFLLGSKGYELIACCQPPTIGTTRSTN
ncbi:hypothetical protein [Saccharopolyspora spinosa]|uniref:hypothetical protein n=1 Tax=Saccharopolyspora spinosa TaxID=60894 RepID=UPI0011D2BD0B